MVGMSTKTQVFKNVETIVKGITWAVDNGADIITMSLGSSNANKNIENAVQYAVKNNVAIFCAAGNSGESYDILYPAKYEGTMSIGAIDKNLKRTNFTCSGETLDFLAPGHEIFGCVPDNKYAIMSGTSMSNPFAVGCASLLLSSLRQKDKNKKLSVEEYISYFKEKAKPLEDQTYRTKKYQGYGILYPY
jgi:subtilisin family serine protease